MVKVGLIRKIHSFFGGKTENESLNALLPDYNSFLAGFRYRQAYAVL